MKTNEIFSWARFGRYAKSMWMLNKKQLLIYLGVAAFIIYTATLVFSVDYYKGFGLELHYWLIFFGVYSIIGGIIFSGNAFPYLRNKTNGSAYLMLPVSATEKLFYEFLTRVVSLIFIIAFLTLLIAPLAEISANYFETLIGRKTVEINYKTDNWTVIQAIFSCFFVFCLVFFVACIAFSGAITFGKLQLYKTIFFVALVLGVIFLYMYLIIEVFHIRYSWPDYFYSHFLQHQFGTELSLIVRLMFLSIILIISSVVLIYYSYFKLKEKEA